MERTVSKAFEMLNQHVQVRLKSKIVVDGWVYTIDPVSRRFMVFQN